jgi:hypothetical protein
MEEQPHIQQMSYEEVNDLTYEDLSNLRKEVSEEINKLTETIKLINSIMENKTYKN